jgi:hypothetical protein
MWEPRTSLMFDTFLFYALPLAFTILVICALTSIVSGLDLLLFKLRKTNELLRHPYLEQQSFDHYPIAIRAAILMDYFFRLSFPGCQFWIIGQANRLLGHIDPKEIPTTIKWPLVGLWGGCLIGLIAMLAVWTLLLFRL